MTSSVFGIPHVETSVLAFFFVGLALEVVVLSKPTHALVSYFALLVGFLVAPNISVLELVEILLLLRSHQRFL